jgi:peptidoglycan/xylan/chitin deacetylase (PgdA/CDA1 family)
MAELKPKSLAGKLGGRLVDRLGRRSDRKAGIILVYHEVAAEYGDWSREVIPALGIEQFRAQLEHVGRRYEVVPLREVLPRAAQRSPGQRLPVALTFDDDLACYDTIVSPLLKELGFPATFFLTGSRLDGPSAFWWQDLQTIIDRGSGAWDQLAEELAKSWGWAALGGDIHEVADTIEALPTDEHEAVTARLREFAGPDAVDDGLSAGAVKRLAESGFEIGFHTRGHVLLPPLDSSQLERALQDGVGDLEAVIGYRPTTISYPYGKANLRVAEAAQRAGFDFGVIGGHGATGSEQHPMLMTRFSASTDSLGSFSLNLARVATA